MIQETQLAKLGSGSTLKTRMSMYYASHASRKACPTESIAFVVQLFWQMRWVLDWLLYGIPQSCAAVSITTYFNLIGIKFIIGS